MTSNIFKFALIWQLIAIASTGALAQNDSKTQERLRPKKVPEITWKNISPPFND